MGLSQFDERNPIHRSAVFDDTYVPPNHPLIDYDANYPTRFDTCIAISNDTVSHTLTVIQHYDTDPPQPLGAVTVPPGAGFGATPPVDVLAALCPPDQKFWLFEIFNSIDVELDSAPSAGKKVIVWLQGGTI